MSLPDITVIIPTYNRKQILLHTLDLLHEHLKYAGQLRYIVCDDGDDGTGEAVVGSGWEDVRLLKQGTRRGLGANLNAGLRAAQSELILQMDDDHWLMKDLDLTPHAAKLTQDATCGWIRLMQLGGHKFQAQLDGMYWRVWWHSPELYIASNRPHLKHRRFHEFYGFYPEGLLTGATEESFCHLCKDRAGQGGRQLDVMIPLDVLTESSWDHVGESWQLKGL